MSKQQHTENKLHPRNKHLHGYDLARLQVANPQLAAFVHVNQFGKETIDFADPKAVFELNKSLLYADYRLKYWMTAKNGLCPAVPGRADYIHYVADLLAEGNGGIVPVGSSVNVLDVGVGSSVIYPILGAQEYDWNFVGTEIDRNSLNIAQGNINKNIWLKKKIHLRFQQDKENILRGVIANHDKFDVVICNPPFFKSREDNWQSSTKKFVNLQKGKKTPTVQNFRGLPNELWYPGGEKAFVRQLIYDSMDFRQQLGWITSLISDKDHIKPLQAVLEYHKAKEIKLIGMKQGNKVSRFLAWRWG